MVCDRCESNRLIRIQAKSNDLNIHEIPHLNIFHDGYHREIVGVCDGDYVTITFCLDCGQIQGFKTLSDSELKILYDGYEDDEEDGGLSWQQEQKLAEANSDREYEEMLARKYGK